MFPSQLDPYLNSGRFIMGEPVPFLTEAYLTLLKGFLIPAAVVVACTVVPPAIIAGAGFTTVGVAAGSMAAGIQSSIGNVVAGSAFAVLQSVGTTPLVSAGVGAAVGAGSVAAGYGYGAAMSAGNALVGIGTAALALL